MGDLAAAISAGAALASLAFAVFVYFASRRLAQPFERINNNARLPKRLGDRFRDHSSCQPKARP